MAMKLTKPQMTLLIDLYSKGPKRVDETYMPAKKLVQLGFATWRSIGAFGVREVTLTPVGRAYVKGD